MDAIAHRRMAFAKALYGVARTQAQSPGALSTAALLTFHDVIELWLRLAAEHLGASLDSQELMKGWDAVSAKLGADLPGKERIRRLVKARVNLKHYGIMPSAQDLRDFLDATTSFLQEATSLVFKVSFSDISLVDLVPDVEIAALLREAQSYLSEARVREALEAMAKAFYCFRSYLQDSTLVIAGRPPVRILRRSPPHLSRGDATPDLARFLEYSENSMEELRSRLSMLELGIDVPRMRRFSAFVPGVTRSMDKKFHILRSGGMPAFEATPEEADECFAFLLDTAIQLAPLMAAPATPASS